MRSDEPPDYLKPVVEAVAQGADVDLAGKQQLAAITRERAGLYSRIESLREEERFISALVTRYAHRLSKTKTDTPEPDAAADGIERGLTDREKLAARELADQMLRDSKGDLTNEQLVAAMREAGYEMAGVKSPATAVGTILYHRRKAYERSTADPFEIPMSEVNP